ncbi:MAG: CBU_0592 family membrane protein [Candidatus Woesearchaeota archaeon]
MIIGIIGMTILVSAYLLAITGKLGAQSVHYLGLNIIASVLLGIYAYMIMSWPFLAINIVWITGSVYQIFRNKNS